MVNSSVKYIDFKIICYYIGYITIGFALLMLLPLLVAVLFREQNPALDFLISIAITTILGFSLVLIGRETREKKLYVQWKHGFVVASLSWLIAMVLGAIPYLLSGHFGSLLDACFDVMSGLTTTGLVMMQDLDHISLGLNMWRHLLTFVGGQGIVVLALSFLVKGTSGAYKFYVGEAKDIELVPNVKGTARIIWKISMVYLVIGTLTLWINGMLIGLQPVSAFFHGLFIFTSSWSTGGFAPNSQNIMYYHSLTYEMITVTFFVLGSFNFGLHYAVWQGNKKELFKNIETQVFFIVAFLASLGAVVRLARLNIYSDAVSIFRRVVYSILSAQTTTGLSNIYARQFVLEWGDFGILILIIAMLIGGSACSTAGGFKGLRVGVVVKGFFADIRKILSSERNIRVYKFHHIKDYVLEDGIVKSSALIILCYLVLFSVGTAMGTYYGYPLADSAFEAASVTGNVGLSTGVTSPSMPTLMKIYYIIAMFLGRLEFLSVFAMIGYFFGGIKKLCAKARKI